MPKLSEIKRKEKTITLDNGLEITYYDGLLVGETEQLMGIESQVEQGIKMLSILIKSWNLTDDSGKVLEITPELIKELPATALTQILTELKPLTEEKKMKLPDLSAEANQAEQVLT